MGNISIVMLMLVMAMVTIVATGIITAYRGRYLYFYNVERILDYSSGELKVGNRGLLRLNKEDEPIYVIEFEFDGKLFESSSYLTVMSNDFIKFSKPWSKDIKQTLKDARRKMIMEERQKKRVIKIQKQKVLKEKRGEYLRG